MDFNDYFLGSDTSKHKSTFYKTIDKGLEFYSGSTRNNKVLNYLKPEEIKNIVAENLPTNSSDIDSILKSLDLIGKYSVSQSDLNYVAFPDSGNSVAALVGDIYSKFINQNLIAFDRSAPYATFIEIQLIEWLRELIGYEHISLKELSSLSQVSGMCTTGGHMSNHIAVMSALNVKYPNIKKTGLTHIKEAPKIILAGDISHYSFSSAMHHLGLGQDNIINCPSNSDFTTDIEELERILQEHIKLDDIFMVVCVAGNSRTSSIDNIADIYKICEKYKIWLHVDACHGGSLLFSKKLKERDLKSIELADSISIDPHKGMFVTYPLSYVLFKQRDILVNFTRYEESVRNGSAWDLGYITPFYGSRGFESLKLWLLIKHIGLNKLAEIVEDRDLNAKVTAKLIQDTGQFTLFNEMTFYRLVFVFYPHKYKHLIESKKLSPETILELKKCIDYFTHLLNEVIYRDGIISLDEFKLLDLNNSTSLGLKDSRFFVSSLTVGNPLQNSDQLNFVINKLSYYAKKLEDAYYKKIMSILDGKEFNLNFKSAPGPAGWK